VVSDTRWLDEHEQHTWRSFLTVQRLLFDGLERQLQQDSGLPHTYYEILVRLSEAPERTLRMSELASIVNSSQSRLSHAIARLEERGWVRREKCPSDKRGSMAVLTDAGYDVLVASAPGHVEAVRSNLFDQLTPEQVRQLGEVCATVLPRLDPERMSLPYRYLNSQAQSA
jgi:DNA-binding MarR family transcriptional regulator